MRKKEINKEQVFLVGGAVRDILLGIDPKDKDYVVVGHTEQDMLGLGYEQVGKDFPVFLHPETGFEYALARKERKTGAGYNGFSVETKDVTLEDDLFRRDLTINAMAMDQNGNLIDPYGGQDDLKNGILRHVSTHFAEDPVRILRIARFSARYNFSIADTTKEMMKKMIYNGEFDSLTPERVWKEFDKVLSEKYLNNFFSNLEEIGALQKVPGFSQIKEKEFFDYVQQNSSSIYTANLLHVFSQMNNAVLLKWKMPADEQHKITQFTAWKNVESFYSSMEIEDKLKFIQLNRSMQNQEKSLEIIENICLYNSWKHEKNHDSLTEKNALKQDIDTLKSLGYENIVAEAKELKVKPNELIKSYQLSALKSGNKKNNLRM